MLKTKNSCIEALDKLAEKQKEYSELSKKYKKEVDILKSEQNKIIQFTKQLIDLKQFAVDGWSITIYGARRTIEYKEIDKIT